jgi:hypothetical protein
MAAYLKRVAVSHFNNFRAFGRVVHVVYASEANIFSRHIWLISKTGNGVRKGIDFQCFDFIMMSTLSEVTPQLLRVATLDLLNFGCGYSRKALGRLPEATVKCIAIQQ